MTAKDFKIARLAMGLTQTALAKKLGVSRSNVVRYEKGSIAISNTIAILLAILAAPHHKKSKELAALSPQKRKVFTS